MGADDRARDVVLARLHAQVALLEELEPKARRDDDDAVHRMRTTTRRLSSALATFAPLIDPASGDRLRSDLRRLAGVLGTVRDAEVMRDRLLRLATEDGGADVDPGVLAGLAGELHARHRAAHAELLETLDSQPHRELLADLDVLLRNPPWRAAAGRPADTTLPPLVRRDWRRVEERAVHAAACEERVAQEVARHELRKAAKRLRYACEAVAPVFGPSAVDLGAAAEHLQDVLGEYHDSVVSRELVRRLAAEVTDPALLERLLVLEQQREVRAEAELDGAWRAIADPRLRAWLIT